MLIASGYTGQTIENFFPSGVSEVVGVRIRSYDASVTLTYRLGSLETVAALATVRKPPPRIKVSRVGQQHISKAQGGNATTISWERVKFSGSDTRNRQDLSLIDTVRYINWPRRLILYIYRLCGRIPKTYEWNERKRIFDPNQIRRAWRVLNEQRWLVPASEMWVLDSRQFQSLRFEPLSCVSS
jgi:hypothetical protein